MANIQISDLRSADANLLLNSETYLSDLTEYETKNTVGGCLICTGDLTVVGDDVIDDSFNDNFVPVNVLGVQAIGNVLGLGIL